MDCDGTSASEWQGYDQCWTHDMHNKLMKDQLNACAKADWKGLALCSAWHVHMEQQMYQAHLPRLAHMLERVKLNKMLSKLAGCILRVQHCRGALTGMQADTVEDAVSAKCLVCSKQDTAS